MWGAAALVGKEKTSPQFGSVAKTDGCSLAYNPNHATHPEQQRPADAPLIAVTDSVGRLPNPEQERKPTSFCAPGAKREKSKREESTAAVRHPRENFMSCKGILEELGDRTFRESTA
eukprot:457261-Pelagomonas_calceolata.AAC.7